MSNAKFVNETDISSLLENGWSGNKFDSAKHVTK
jgi:hypothetical protein